MVLDTPGLNAIGAEPELTLGLLPAAHATVFILGADTGVTAPTWRSGATTSAATRSTRFVVLNKIDTLVDPLATAEQVRGADRAPAPRDGAHAGHAAASASFRCRRARRWRRASTATPRRCSAAACRRWKRRWRSSCCRAPRAAGAWRSRGRAAAAPRRGAPPRRPPPPARRADARAARPARQERRQGAADAAARRRRDGRVRALHRAAAGAARGAQRAC